MKRIAKALALVLTVATLLTACAGKPKDAIAKVNGEYITKADFDREYGIFRKMMYGQIPDEELSKTDEQGSSIKAELEKRVTDVMIMDKLMDAEIKKNKIEITDEDRAAERERMIEQTGGEEKFKEQLEKEDLSDDDITYVINKGLKQSKLKEWFIEENKVTDEEVNQFFEEHKDELVSYEVAHILVDTEEEANEIKKELDGGKDFAELAKEKSTDEGSAVNGGDLGQVRNNTPFVEEFMTAMKALKAGEISDPVQSQFGYHIIYLKSVADTVEDLRETIETSILEPKFQAYVGELYSKAEIETYKSSEEAAPVQEQKEETPADDTEKQEEATPEETEKPAEDKKD